MITKTITIFQNYSQSELIEIQSKCLQATRNNEPIFRYNKHHIKTNDFLNAYQYLQIFNALNVKYDVSKNLLFNAKGNLNKPETIKNLCQNIALILCRNIIENNYPAPAPLQGYFPNAKFLHDSIMQFCTANRERDFIFDNFHHAIKYSFPRPITKQFSKSLLKSYYEVKEVENYGVQMYCLVSKIDSNLQIDNLLTSKYYMPEQI